MFLTRVQLDLNKRKTLKAFSAPNLFHGAVEQSFDGERGRNLWRIDRLNGHYYMLLLSERVPDVSRLQEQFCTETGPEVRDYQKLLDRIKNGDVWNFKLVANPTNSINSGDKGRGKVVAHVGIKHQKEWLIKKADRNGFLVDSENFQISGNQWYSFQKQEKGKRVTMLSVTYEGTLQIKDSELFKKALVTGIGREKAYGMGMLTITNQRNAI